MSSVAEAAAQALRLIAGADPKLLDIVLLSLRVSLTAVGISCGFDESAYVYAWDGQRWRRAWEHERTTYTPKAYLPQIIHDVTDADGN